MSAFFAIACVVGGSLIISAAFGMGLGRLIHRADVEELVNRPSYPPPPPIVRWQDYEPPAPCADWFYDVPVDCLSDDAIKPLFDSIVDGEFA